MSDTINARLQRGEIVQVGNRIYAVCAECKQIVCINKPLFGTLHFCDVADPRPSP